MVEWYTRWSKKPMPQGLRVQVSPVAPDVVLNASLAQGLEQSTHNRSVTGSNPVGSTMQCPNGEIGSTQEIQNLPLKGVSVRV